MRSKALKDQKIEILEQRKEMKKQAMLQKTKINEAFEKMKNKGKLDPNIIQLIPIASKFSYSCKKSRIVKCFLGF